MNLNTRIGMLGGLSPAQFMQRHWQRRPLLVRAAWPDLAPPLTRAELFALAARDDVESRLVTRAPRVWSLRHGPIPRRSLPPLRQRQWALLVQGVDLHVDAAHAMLQRFRFVTDARLDDLMVSFATDGGGVGPHLDAYDVFLLQLQGSRRWRIGPVREPSWVAGAPLKRLRHFRPTEEWVLGPGDMLYLPPLWGHDGVAVGACLTASIGFRAPQRCALLGELMHRVADAQADAVVDDTLYRDPPRAAARAPARIPSALQDFARDAWQRLQHEPRAVERALGEVLSEPKAQVWFQPGAAPTSGAKPVRLDRRTRMMYDTHHVFVNGESFACNGRDTQCLRRLADERVLSAEQLGRLTQSARRCVDEWARAGWLHEY